MLAKNTMVFSQEQLPPGKTRMGCAIIHAVPERVSKENHSENGRRDKSKKSGFFHLRGTSK
jgi:hypothetical protein